MVAIYQSELASQGNTQGRTVTTRSTHARDNDDTALADIPDNTDAPTLIDEEKALVASIVREKPWRGLIYYTSYPFRYSSVLMTTIVLCIVLKPSTIEGSALIILSSLIDYSYFRLTRSWRHSDYSIVRKILIGEKFQAISGLKRTIGKQIGSIFITSILVSWIFFIKSRGGLNTGHEFLFFAVWALCLLCSIYLKLFSHSKDFPEDRKVKHGETLRTKRNAYSSICFGYTGFVIPAYTISILMFLTVIASSLFYGGGIEIFSQKALFFLGAILVLFVDFFARVNFACKAHHVAERLRSIS